MVTYPTACRKTAARLACHHSQMGSMSSSQRQRGQAAYKAEVVAAQRMTVAPASARCVCQPGTIPQPHPVAMSFAGAALQNGSFRSLSAPCAELMSQPRAWFVFTMLISSCGAVDDKLRAGRAILNGKAHYGGLWMFQALQCRVTGEARLRRCNTRRR